MDDSDNAIFVNGGFSDDSDNGDFAYPGILGDSDRDIQSGYSKMIYSDPMHSLLNYFSEI